MNLIKAKKVVSQDSKFTGDDTIINFDQVVAVNMKTGLISMSNGNFFKVDAEVIKDMFVKKVSDSPKAKDKK